MGLLDFLKKGRNTSSPTAQPTVDAIPSDTSMSADQSVTISPKGISPEPVAATPQVAPEPLPAQPQTVFVPEPDDSGQTASVQQHPETVTAFDEFGRQVQIPFAQWREMMQAELEGARDEPERLAGAIVQALQFGLAGEALQPAQRLHETDPDKERGTTLLGIVLLETGDAAGAARLFAAFLTAQQQRGEKPSAIILTNHAKALQALGNTAAGEAILWQAMQADPNQENGLLWFGAIAKDQGGQDVYLEAMRRVAALPGAWRAQIWLARAALETKDISTARALYRESLERAGSPAPVVLLQSMSGDLGTQGYLEDALALTRPAYDAQVHGLAVGNNLIKAAFDTGRLDDAHTLLEQLQRIGRPDWSEHLGFWEMQIKQAALQREGSIAPAQPDVSALAIEGPVWLPAQSPARSLFGTPSGAKVLFLAASVNYAEPPRMLEGMLPDAQGRVSRSLPLFLAESAYLHMGLDTVTVIPWVKDHGFAVMSGEWAEADAAEYARNAGAVGAVILSIQQTGEKTEISLRVVSAKAATEAAPARRLTVPIDWQQTGNTAVLLWSQMAHALLPLVRDTGSPSGGGTPLDAARYVIPAGQQLGNYLLRLEQLLAVRCAGTDQPAAEQQGRGFLTGEREMVRGQLDLALSMPQSLPLRLILHETLLRMRDLRPEILVDVHAPVRLLQQRYPFADAAANAVLEQQLQTIFRATSPPAEFSSSTLSA